MRFSRKCVAKEIMPKRSAPPAKPCAAMGVSWGGGSGSVMCEGGGISI